MPDVRLRTLLFFLVMLWKIQPLTVLFSIFFDCSTSKPFATLARNQTDGMVIDVLYILADFLLIFSSLFQ
jgi:hypothetical protein